jgi:lysophospholipase L1-like esterase
MPGILRLPNLVNPLKSFMQSSSDLNQSSLKRRQFLQAAGLAVGGAWLGGCVSSGEHHAHAGDAHGSAHGSLVAAGDTVLFQGDSITDAGRSRPEAGQANHQLALGNGYAWLAGAQLLLDRPKDHLMVYNRGISGNKVFQLANRWQADCLDLKPNLLSVLIGVNDIWHGLNGNYDGTVETYERDFMALLTRTREALPAIKLVVCEPFVLRCGAVTDKWFPLFDEYRVAAKRVATSFHASWVPFQGMFDEAVKYAPAEHWAKDGVHPSSAGASLMAHAWLKEVYHPGLA